ncbi:MAG: hypothetical protein A3G26_00895 [Betaproteobacteria bacterium RIFCSPLOWO2_12_FULL_65_110]|nr:MAG: hypothetical protein A3G26_00895 [Betaproteobacteria bacterium RIFCSPLOWO2_12_FULL_65_110]
MPCFKSPVLLTLALLSALGPHLASPALAAEDPGARIPASIEVWVEGIPDGATHHVAKLRGAWTLYVDYLRLTQSVDAQAGRAATLLGPGVNDGDFESGGGGLNAYLAQSLSVVESSAAGVPAARGRKFLAMVADPTVDRHFPRVIKYLPMPDLSRGRYFVLTGKVRAKQWDGITYASVAVVFINKNKAQFRTYYGERVALTPEGWVEVRVEFDYVSGIPKKNSRSDLVTREDLAAQVEAERAKSPASDIKHSAGDRVTRDPLAVKVEAERAQWPAYDITPRPDDGRNLALSVAKWEGRAGIPGKPFRVWFVGASWTCASWTLTSPPPAPTICVHSLNTRTRRAQLQRATQTQWTTPTTTSCAFSTRAPASPSASSPAKWA